MKTPIVNFSKGEIGPQLYSRIDASQYATGLRRARNVVVQRYGGVSSRPGTRMVAPLAQQDQPARLVPFQSSIDQAYVLVFQQAAVQAMAFGGLVLEADNLKIVSATTTNPVVLEIPYHGFAIGDRLYVDGLTGMGQLNRRLVTITAVPDANHVTINVNGLTFTALTDSTGTVRVAAPPPPPPPPPAPTPSPPPPPPPETGGGGGTGGGLCVADDTPILMGGVSLPYEMAAQFLKVGSLVYTQHETTLEWGAYPVEAIHFAYEPVMAATIGARRIRATANHRFHIDGEWIEMHTIGEPDGSAWVAKITVSDAHTYVSAGVLSHNIKSTIRDYDDPGLTD